MAIHGKSVSDDSKYIRIKRGEEDEIVRVFLHEDWYQYLKPLYEYAELIASGVSIKEIPNQIESSFEWLSAVTIELGAYGWIFSIAIIGWMTHLAKNKISLGEFTYETVGARYDNVRYGFQYGGVTQILELPIEG